MVIVLIASVAVFVIIVLIKNPKDKALGGNLNYLKEIPTTEPTEKKETLTFLEHLNRGNTLVSQYQYDEALHHFKQALKLKTDEPSVHFKIGRIFLQKEDFKNALSAFKTSLSLNPNQVEAHYEMARIYQLIHQAEPAHAALGNALKINPTHEESLKLKIKLLEQEKRYEQALGYIQKLVDSSRNPLKYRDQMADFMMNLGQYPEAIAELEALIALDPSNQLHYRGKIGQAYFDQSQFSKAIEFFKQVLQDQSDTKDIEYIHSVKSQMGAALCNEGVKRYEMGDSAGAIQRYTEALLYDDSNADIHYNLGKALIRTQETAKAIQHFESALAINPNDASCYYELAILQDEKGLIKEAMANYEKVLQLEPQNAQAYFGLGTLYGVEGNMDKSIQHLSSAIRVNPNYVDAFYNLAVALERKKDINKAIKMYKKVLSLDKNHDKAKSNLAHIQHTRQDSAK